MKTRNMLLFTAALSLATSSLAGAVTKTYSRQTTANYFAAGNQQAAILMAGGEPEPGDKRGKGDDGAGHKFNPLSARGEPEPGDDRRGRGKDDGKGHKVNPLMARGEPEPGDKRGKKDDGTGHKFAPSLFV